MARRQRLGVEHVEAHEVRLGASRHDAAEQRVSTNHVVLRADGIRLRPVTLRYAWPAELDLMARLAGLGLLERWGGWSREAFTSASTQHVSVYARS